MEEITISQSYMKGYQTFKITPHKEIKMQVLKEVNNKKRSSCYASKNARTGENSSKSAQ